MYDVTYEEYGRFKTFVNIDKLIFFLTVGFVKVSICFLKSTTNVAHIPSVEHFQQCFPVLTICLHKYGSFLEHLSMQSSICWLGCDQGHTTEETVLLHERHGCWKYIDVLHVIVDFGLLSVCLIALWKVRMGWFTRFRLYFVFSIVSMSVVGSILRQKKQEKLSATDILCMYHSIPQGELI
jgi:hypothetical protein